MTVDVFGALLLIASGIGIAEAYHIRQRVMVRVLQGLPAFKPFPKPAPKAKAKPIRRKWWECSNPRLPIRDEMHVYPTPAVKAFRRESKVIPVEVWTRLQKERRVKVRRVAGEWRVG